MSTVAALPCKRCEAGASPATSISLFENVATEKQHRSHPAATTIFRIVRWMLVSRWVSYAHPRGFDSRPHHHFSHFRGETASRRTVDPEFMGRNHAEVPVQQSPVAQEQSSRLISGGSGCKSWRENHFPTEGAAGWPATGFEIQGRRCDLGVRLLHPPPCH